MNILNYRRILGPSLAGLTLAVTMAGCTPTTTANGGGAPPAQATSPASVNSSPHDMAMTPTPGHTHAPGEIHDHGSASPSPGAMDHDMGTKSMEWLSGLSGKDFDIAFMSQMIAHHQGAIDMAKQALTVAKAPETKAEAQKVIDAQTAEIVQMTGWLKDWYSVVPDAEQQALMKDDMKGMMSMPITDDKMFYQMMIPHHQGAIAMAEMVDAKSDKPELEELAKKIIAAQQSEIQQYQDMMAK